MWLPTLGAVPESWMPDLMPSSFSVVRVRHFLGSEHVMAHLESSQGWHRTFATWPLLPPPPSSSSRTHSGDSWPTWSTVTVLGIKRATSGGAQSPQGLHHTMFRGQCSDRESAASKVGSLMPCLFLYPIYTFLRATPNSAINPLETHSCSCLA